jgi:hypothetical protein
LAAPEGELNDVFPTCHDQQSEERRGFWQPGSWLSSPWPKLLAVLAHDRRCGLQANADGAALVDEGAFGGNSFDNILGGQNRRHSMALGRARVPNFVYRFRIALVGFRSVIPDIDIWRAAGLMLKRYGENAHKESAAAIWRLITDAVARLANTIPTGPVN